MLPVKGGGMEIFMNKKEEMIKKIEMLLSELDEAKKSVDVGTIEYLCKLQEIANAYIEKINEGILNASQGGNLGFRRSIIEYDNLAMIDSLYDAAKDVDAYYCNEYKE